MDIVSLVLIVFGIFAIILDKYFLKKDSLKYRIIITIVFVLCFLGSYLSQYFDSRELKIKLSNIENQNMELRNTSIESLKTIDKLDKSIEDKNRLNKQRKSHALKSVYSELYELCGTVYSTVRNVSAFDLNYDHSKSYQFIYEQGQVLSAEISEQKDYLPIHFLSLWEPFERKCRYIKFHSSPAILYGEKAAETVKAGEVDRVADFYFDICQLMKILEEEKLFPEDLRMFSEQPSLKSHYEEVRAWKKEKGWFSSFERKSPKE